MAPLFQVDHSETAADRRLPMDAPAILGQPVLNYRCRYITGRGPSVVWGACEQEFPLEWRLSPMEFPGASFTRSSMFLRHMQPGPSSLFSIDCATNESGLQIRHPATVDSRWFAKGVVGKLRGQSPVSALADGFGERGMKTLAAPNPAVRSRT